jgi:hypothetical protein
MLFVILLASFGISLGYDILFRAGESGFALGQWMVAASTVALTALYFSLEDDADSRYD